MSDRDDIRRLAQILDKFMVGMLNNLTGIISTQPGSLHVQALDELHGNLSPNPTRPHRENCTIVIPVCYSTRQHGGITPFVTSGYSRFVSPEA